MMTCQVSCGNQNLILGHSEVCQMSEFCQYVQTLGDWGLDLGGFLAKILKERFL